jgi:capsid protein
VVPLEVQLLEPDHLDNRATLDAVERKPLSAINAEGVVVDQGIEYDLNGKRKGYWIYPVHPGARGLVMPSASIKVDAADMLHVYRKDRIGQGRGVPWVRAGHAQGPRCADLEEAVVVKARIEACLAAFIKTNDTARTLGAKGFAKRKQRPTADAPHRNLSPGMIAYLDQGEELQTVSPSSSVQFEAVLKATWLTIAAGAGITYDQLTGDLARANFPRCAPARSSFAG